MAYEKQSWQPGDPITQDRMDHIENGIFAAHTSNATNATNISNANGEISSLKTRMNSAEGDIGALTTNVSQYTNQTAKGAAAWDVLSGAIEYTGTPEGGNLVVSKPLDDRLVDTEGLVSAVTSEVSTARKGKLKLVDKITDLENNISTLAGGIGSISEAFATASVDRGGTDRGSVHARITYDEGQIALLAGEISDARTSEALARTGESPIPFGQLDLRLEEDETRIVNVQKELADAHESDNFKKTGNNKYTSIDKRFEAIEKQIADAWESTSYGKTQANENAYTTLDDRFEAIETEIKNARGTKSTLIANLNAIENNNVNYEDIINSHIWTGAERTKALDANQGAILAGLIETVESGYQSADSDIRSSITTINNTLGTGFNTGNNTVAKAITAAINTAANDATSKANTAKQDAKDYADSKFGTGITTSSTVTAQIKAINDKIGTGYDSTNTVKQAIAAAEATAAADATSKANAAQAAAIAAAATDATNKANAAQSAAEATAAADATSKANTAKQDAKDYADSKFGTGITTGNTVTTQLKAINDKFGSEITSSNKVTDAIATAKQQAISAAASDAATKATNAKNDAINTAEQYADNLIYNGLNKEDTGFALDAHQGKVLYDTLNNSTTGLGAIKTIADRADTNAASALNKIGTGFDNTTVRAELNTKANASDVTTALAGKASTTSVTNLTNTVDGLLDRDTIVIDKPANGSNYTHGIPNMNTEDIKPNCDYLIADDDEKYYYWRYINNQWELISGAGSGTSSGLIVNQLPNANEADENTDYFVYDSTTESYLHYRFIKIDNVKQAVLIGANLSNIKQYNIEKIVSGDKTYLRLYEFNYGDDNAINLDNTAVFPWVASTSYEVNDLVLYQGYFYTCLTANNDSEWNSSHWQQISDMRAVTTIELPQGGGGGSSTGAVTRFIRLAPTSITTIQNNEPIYIHFFYSCVDPSAGSFEGHYTLTDKNGVSLLTDSINSGSGTDIVTTWPQDKEDGQIYNDGYGSINVAPYCVLGKNTFNLEIITGTNESFTRTWSVDIKQLNIESNAPDSIVAEVGETIDLTYIPYGAMQKTLIVKVDGTQVKTESLGAGVTGTEQICTIPAQSVTGAHKIELQLSAYINGDTKYSESITRDYIWYNAANTDAIIISSPYRNSQITTTQYSEIVIPYTIYKANTNNFIAEYYYEYNPSGENIPFDSVTLNNTNSGTIRYIPTEASLEDNQHSTSNNKVYIPNHITIKVENTTLTFDFIATPMEIDIAPVAGAIIDFNPTTLNNNSSNRLPSYLSVSDNFNWSTNWEGDNQDSGGGYRIDEDGKCFIIKAGTYAEIDYQMFKQNNIDAGDGTTKTTSAVFDRGAEMKLIFKITNVRDASTVWFSNMGKYVPTSDKKVGIELQAHEGRLMTDKATGDQNVELPEEYKDKVWDKTTAYTVGDIVVYKAIIYKCIQDIAAPTEGENSWNKKAWQSLGQLETEISATNSYLYFPYSEEDKIELDININQQGNHQNFVMSYEDGVPSKAYPYNYGEGGDILYHVLNEESKIHIGSDDCDIHIYRLRIYNKALSTEEILKNFIADGDTIEERINRYNRNSIYYSPELNDGNGGYTPYKTGAAKLDPYRLAERIPDVKILMLDAPRFTTGKKDFVKGSTLRCIQASGGKVYPANLDKDNWYFFNGYHAGQGTTSDNYGQSARNVDFLFECDGTHAPTKKGNLASTDFPDINYVSGVVVGANNSVYDERTKSWSIINGASIDTCNDWMDDSCRIALTHIRNGQAVSDDTSIPNNYFNLKVNVASSENVNNALFQKRYNDFLPYTSPAKNRDSRIKNDMEFVPAILFIRERGVDLNGNTVERKEFNDDEWHFYALGNLGDSKKTDYTRAYDPEDMNEFTIEISDNNTANSQFQSGVFLSTERYIVENPLVANLASYEEAVGEVTLKDGTNNAYLGIFVATEDEEIVNGKTYYYRQKIVETNAMADDVSISQDPMKYIYPITSEQWNAKDGNGKYINYRHQTLSTDKFDGDHSFEFRYACKGAFRDGDIINPYDENDPYYAVITQQEGKNRAVWEAFYEWIVTSTKEQFRSEAALWFVPSAIEFFYAFTHYYTMMDNRAKNTFWHFAKTGIHRPVTRPVEALYHIYEVADGNVTVSGGIATGNFKEPTGAFNPNGTYYTQYAFDLWVYDTDTACGIDNNGELSFPYGKEDRDYRTGEAASGWAFNGSGSIFWRRLSDPSDDGGFANEISALMRQEDDSCFATAQHLINQFDEFQNCFPEEIWRLDIERKYIRTFTGLSIDGSLTANKQNIRFLRAMMQGRKKYQRRQWVRNQAVYFGSKYGLSNVRTSDHTIEFNIYTPSATDGVTTLAVPVDQSKLVIKPYQDMYIDVAVGNTTTNLRTQDFRRAKAGELIEIDCRSEGGAQETRVYIFGGEHIAALENLAPMYTYSGSFGHGKRLKVLDLGSDNPNYNNPRFTSISINENMPLLERFSVKNCNRLAQSIDLHLSNNLREFEADGSLITGVSLPAYTNIEKLHLPNTVTNVALNSARALDDFYIKDKSTGLVDYSKLIILNINDSDYSDNIDWMAIAKTTLSNSINTLYLQNLNKAHIGDINELEVFDQKKKALETTYDSQGNLIIKLVLSGYLTVNGTWSATEVNYYSNSNTGIWPRLTLTTLGREETKWPVVYQHNAYTLDDGTEVPAVEYKIVYVNDNTIAPDIYDNGTLGFKPEQPNTVQHTYTFGQYDGGEYIPYSGWKLSNGSSNLQSAPVITGPTTLETWFESTTRTYPINWYLYENKTGLIKTSEDLIEYGQGANQEAPSVIDIHNKGYSTATVSITNGAATYRIFKGWQELPNKIHPSSTDTSFDIYADWEENTVSLGTMFAANNISNLTPEQLLVLSAMNDDQKKSCDIYNKIEAGATKIEYTIGQDNDSGTLLIGNDSIPVYRGDRTRTILRDGLVFDGSTYTINGNSVTTPVIQPFKAGNDAFTIAIDYSFNPDWTYENTFGVLASCYNRNTESNTVTGFTLYYYNTNSSGVTAGPRIGFGDIFSDDQSSINRSVAIGNPVTAPYRNIIVLRHPAGTNTLYIYSGLSDENGLPQEIVINNKTWSSLNSDTCLRFGCLADQATLASSYADLNVDYGGGTIYWAKYWNEDLGLGECKRLAMWPHEKMTYLLTNLTTTPTANNRAAPTGTAPVPSIYLTSLTASIHGLIGQNSVAGPAISWSTEPARAITNGRAYLGLPIKLQSILCKKEVTSREMVRTNSIYDFNTSSSIKTRDYLYLLSGSNIADGSSSNKPGYNYTTEEISAMRPFNHIDASNVEVKKYNANDQTWENYTNINYPYELLNLRFALKPIDWSDKLRVFIDANRDLSSVSISNLRAGDIFIDGSEDGGQAYMYVTNDDGNNLGIYTSSSNKFKNNNGGWTPAYPYWLRSVARTSSQGAAGYLAISRTGYMPTEATKTGNGAYVYANLNYSMAI